MILYTKSVCAYFLCKMRTFVRRFFPRFDNLITKYVHLQTSSILLKFSYFRVRDQKYFRISYRALYSRTGRVRIPAALLTVFPGFSVGTFTRMWAQFPSKSAQDAFFLLAQYGHCRLCAKNNQSINIHAFELLYFKYRLAFTLSLIVPTYVATCHPYAA